MKALTLTQPWATLVAIGAKQIETRTWGTSYRGPIAIHAAKGFPLWAKSCVLDDWDFFGALNPGHAAFLKEARVTLIPSETGRRELGKLPLGSVIATAWLLDVLPTVSTGCLPGVFDDYPELDTSQERAFGDFSQGRWGWVLQDVKPLPMNEPYRGALSLWEWPVPENVKPQISEMLHRQAKA